VQEFIFLDDIPSVQKAPLTFELLFRITSSLSPSLLPDLRLLTLSWLSYDGFLRIGELLRAHKKHSFLWSSDRTSVDLLLNGTKTQRGIVHISYCDRSGPCAVKFLRMWFTMNELWSSAPMTLVFPSIGTSKKATHLSHGWFRKMIKKLVFSIGLDSTLYSGHSFRAGAATDMFRTKVPYAVIKEAGRWLSDCVLCYYRDAADRLSKKFSAFAFIARNAGVV